MPNFKETKSTVTMYVFCTSKLMHAMKHDDSSYRLNFDLGKKNKIHHHN
jgi:hypothetical protein